LTRATGTFVTASQLIYRRPGMGRAISQFPVN